MDVYIVDINFLNENKKQTNYGTFLLYMQYCSSKFQGRLVGMSVTVKCHPYCIGAP